METVVINGYVFLSLQILLDKCEVILAIGIALIGQKHKFDIRTFLQTMPEFLCRPNLSLTGCTPHCPEIQNNIATRV